jgi:RNA polymerase sigma-70 factor (ECF subfamily)
MIRSGDQPRDREETLLLAAARRGESAALDTLARAHTPALRSLLTKLGARPEDAEDVLQETWIAAQRALPAFRGDGSLLGWLGRIATNAYRDLLRSGRRLSEIQDYLLPSRAAGPAECAARREMADRVTAAMEELPPRQRETLRLRVVEGLRYEEIAERMGVGRDAVRMNLIQARRKLLRRFGGEVGKR